jgi:O-acetyl-ADP-ribose deacetylase (regulator of RNase III)
MGSGVAKAIKEKYPKAFQDYRQAALMWIKYDHSPEEVLGRVIHSIQPDGKVILNAITQQMYGNDGAKYVSYDAVDKAFLKIAQDVAFCGRGLSMPKIGAGLGGGNWEVIEAIIKHRLANVDVTVWELE